MPDLLDLGKGSRRPAEILPRHRDSCDHNQERGFVQFSGPERIFPELVDGEVADCVAVRKKCPGDSTDIG
jgi:hypothetical protein